MDRNCGTVARETEVSRMMSDLEKEIANLMAIVDGLGEKLNGVRTPKPQNVGAKDCNKMPSMCMLAESLKNKVIGVQQIIVKVRMINEEIEL